ncbi:MAG TPA: GerMN domain-containing protein [bacterium]|nr:GerMN domain-containing protein [bacterium]
MKTSEKVVIWSLLGLLVVLIAAWATYKKGWWSLPASREIYVYFVRHSRNEAELVPVRRKSSGRSLQQRVRLAVGELIAGPTEEEKKEGLYNAVPAATRLLDCRVENGTVWLDFSAEVEEGGGTQDMEERLAQIVFTATQFDEASQVQLLIEGKTLKYFGGEGITEVEHPLKRRDFAGFYSGGKP